MVYCGKPSKGCGQCRSRKIRCDQARPACSQCTRAKRDCPGYRDELALMFRDQSESVAQKAETAPLRSKRAPERSSRGASPDGNPSRPELVLSVDPDVFDFNADPQHEYLMRQLWHRPLEIQPPPGAFQQEVISYFLQSNALPGSFWDMMTNFLRQTEGPPSQKAIQASMAAVAMATLSRIRKVPALREAARKEYGSALKLLNTALADVEQAKTNQVLGAVVLLAVYEIVTSRNPQSISGWTNHIRGATALLELRGTQQLRTEAGLRLFLHLRYQIIISCIQRDTHVPESLLECTKFAMYLRPREAHGNSLIIIIGKLSNLRADIRNDSFRSPQEIISAASAIEAELIAWLAALPPDFTYATHTKSPFDASFQSRCQGISPYDDQYHVYPDLWVCNTWNQYRCARIIVSEIILSHIWQLSDASPMRSLSREFRLQCNTLQSNNRRLAVEICRSVPYNLGVHRLEDQQSRQPPPESYIGGLTLLWPLFLAGVVEPPNHSLRRWVVQCLRVIGDTMGLDQALALMDIVAADPGIFRSVAEEDETNGGAGAPEGTRRHPVALISLEYSEIPASGE